MHSIQKVLPILLIVASSGLAGPVLSRRTTDLLVRNYDERYGHHEDGYGHQHHDEDYRKQGGLANGGDAGNGGYGGDGGHGGYLTIKNGEHSYARRTEDDGHHGSANGGLGGLGGNGGNGGYGGKIDKNGASYGHDDARHGGPEGNGGHGGLGGNGGHGGNGGEIAEESGGHHNYRRGIEEQLDLAQLLALPVPGGLPAGEVLGGNGEQKAASPEAPQPPVPQNAPQASAAKRRQNIEGVGENFVADDDEDV